ncbi:MAG: stage III sporulation protein AA [Lachnospiraceae bacterium]|nr:stage III sporulation protein AA [Lachnospiraceae bacterium]
MDQREALLMNFPANIRKLFSGINENDFKDITEIRLRTGKPLLIIYRGEEVYINKNGDLSISGKGSYITEQEDVENTVVLISNYSPYAFDEDIKRGFITISGGHRAGLSGKVVTEGGKIKTISQINGICLRLSHEIKGCADEAIKYILNKGQVLHTMIISPPGCGKTTLLRDIIRQISDDAGKNVSVIDERSEIAGCYMGIPQRDIGQRTDVMDACPKALGMLMVLRSLAPDVIAVDEIGSKDDIFAIGEILNAGIKLIATVHGKDITDVSKKPYLSELVKTGAFERYIVLSKNKGFGTIEEIYDGALRELK